MGVHDVALIHLEKAITLKRHVDTVCLPKSNPDDKYQESKCVVLGWGETPEESQQQRYMKAVQPLDIVDNANCKNQVQNYTGRNYRVQDGMMCASSGNGQGDACSGDGGGPLVCPKRHSDGESRFELAGIVSSGFGCGVDVPGIYSDVVADLGFIHSATKCKHGNAYKDFYWDPTANGNEWLDRRINELENLPKLSRKKKTNLKNLKTMK